MSPAGLFLLDLGWSALVWVGASLICRMKPAPKLAQAIWRGAALMLAAPFAASLIVPQDGVAVAVPAPAFRLPEIGMLVFGVLAGRCASPSGWSARYVCSASRRAR